MLTKERIDKHALQAVDCPPATWVVLRSAMHRLVDKESAATAPLLARIAELVNTIEKGKDLMGGMALKVAELEQQLEEARKDAADADSMCEAMKKVIDQNDARWKFLHTTNKDSEGFEWCVLRVKWENGRISEALHTYSNMADLDAAIKEQT